MNLSTVLFILPQNESTLCLPLLAGFPAESARSWVAWLKTGVPLTSQSRARDFVIAISNKLTRKGAYLFIENARRNFIIRRNSTSRFRVQRSAYARLLVDLVTAL